MSLCLPAIPAVLAVRAAWAAVFCELAAVVEAAIARRSSFAQDDRSEATLSFCEEAIVMLLRSADTRVDSERDSASNADCKAVSTAVKLASEESTNCACDTPTASTAAAIAVRCWESRSLPVVA